MGVNPDLRSKAELLAAELGSDIDAVAEFLATLSPNAYIYAVDQAGKIRGKKLDGFIAEVVASDIQVKLAANGYEPHCPDCGYPHTQKNGKRGGIQRYRCQKCGRQFSVTSGTILEKTRYTWDVWVDVVYGMLNDHPLASIRTQLSDDRHCHGIELNTVHLMRLKVMNAIASIPSPKLSGVIKIDDTFYRENQKAGRFLVDPLASGKPVRREPRSGLKQSSQLGVRGSEFVTATCMTDSSGHCVIRCLGMGCISQETMRAFVEENTVPGSISFACSDADTTYIGVFRDMNVPHYVRPSDYTSVIEKAGYKSPPKGDKAAARKQWERDERILERLWNEGEIDYILNRGKMTYREFADLKREYNLNLAEVNSLHSLMREAVEKRTRGVASKWLPLYLAWFEYLANRKTDTGKDAVSRKDATEILMEAVATHVNLPYEEVMAARKDPLPFSKPSGKYLRKLEERTAKAREILGDESFRFGAEDGVEGFNVRKLLGTLSDRQLKDLGKATALHDWKHRNRTTLILGLAKLDSIEEILFETIVKKERKRKERSDAKADEWRAKHPYNRQVLKSTFGRDVLRPFTEELLQEVERGSLGGDVVFFDVETTGTSTKSDEVLSLAVVSLSGEPLYEGMFKPLHKRKWDEAAEVNGITPDDVADKPTLLSAKPELDELFGNAGLIVGWNSYLFDMRMLYAGGIDIPNEPERYLDLMEEFVRLWNAMPGRTKQQKLPKLFRLVDTAGMLGIDAYTPDKQHTAAGDAAVLIGIWEWLVNAI